MEINDKATFKKYEKFLKNDNLQKTKKSKIRLTQDEVEYPLHKDLLFINQSAKEDFVNTTKKYASKIVEKASKKNDKIVKIKEKMMKLKLELEQLEQDEKDLNDEIDEATDEVNMFVKAVYNEELTLEEEVEKGEGIEGGAKRKIKDYLQDKEEVLHRIYGKEQNMGAIPLDNKDDTNIWKATYNKEEDNFECNGIIYKNLSTLMREHNATQGVEVKNGNENIWKGSIKVVRKSLCEATKKNDFKQGYYELSCLSKMKPLDQYEANELKVLTTRF